MAGRQVESRENSELSHSIRQFCVIEYIERHSGVLSRFQMVHARTTGWLARPYKTVVAHSKQILLIGWFNVIFRTLRTLFSENALVLSVTQHTLQDDL